MGQPELKFGPKQGSWIRNLLFVGDEQVKTGSGIQISRVKLNKTAPEYKLPSELPTLIQEQLVDMRKTQKQRGTGEEESGHS